MKRILFLIALLTSIMAAAQSKLPTSGDHVFVPLDLMKNPQPVSFFTMSVGLQQSDDIQVASGQLPIIGPVELNGEVLFADFGVRASIRLKDWVSYRLSYSTSVRIGTDVQSLLIQGISSLTSYESLWQIRAFRTPKLCVSGTFGFNRIDGDLIDVVGYIESIRDGVPNPSINRKIRSLTGEVGLLASYAVNSVVGLMFEGEMEIGDHVGATTPRLFWSTRGAIDVNLNAKYNFPLGMAMTFVSTGLPEFVVPVRRQAMSLSLRLAYMGADNYNIGLSISRSRFPLEKVNEKSSFQGVHLSGNFYF